MPENKYILKKCSNSECVYKVTKYGDDNSFFKSYCHEDFNKKGLLFCEGLISSFRFNKNNGRFINCKHFGYIEVNVLPGLRDENSDTPYFEIGKCSSF